VRHKLAESEELLTLTLEYLKRGGTIKRLPYKEPDEHTIYQLGFMRKWEYTPEIEKKKLAGENARRIFGDDVVEGIVDQTNNGGN